MDVATTFLPLLQVFAGKMTQPTFQNFLVLVSGWLAAPHRTILGIVRASGTTRHRGRPDVFSHGGNSVTRFGGLRLLVSKIHSLAVVADIEPFIVLHDQSKSPARQAVATYDRPFTRSGPNV